MSILRRSPRGIIRTIVLLIVIIIILFYLGVDVNSFIETVGNLFKVLLDILIKFTKVLAELVMGFFN